MSIMPDFGVVKSFQVFKPWAKVLGFCAVFAITAVFSLPLIGSQGMNSYIVVLISVSIIVAILLINPIQTVLQQLNTDTAKNFEKAEAGIAQTTSSVSALPSVPNEEIEKQEKKERENVLHKLTHDEKKFLAPYVFRDITSQNVNVMGGVYQSLYRKGVMQPPPAVGYMTRRDVLIQDWAKDYLKKHQEWLQGYENVIPEETPWWWH